MYVKIVSLKDIMYFCVKFVMIKILWKSCQSDINFILFPSNKNAYLVKSERSASFLNVVDVKTSVFSYSTIAVIFRSDYT